LHTHAPHTHHIHGSTKNTYHVGMHVYMDQPKTPVPRQKVM